MSEYKFPTEVIDLPSEGKVYIKKQYSETVEEMFITSLLLMDDISYIKEIVLIITAYVKVILYNNVIH